MWALIGLNVLCFYGELLVPADRREAMFYLLGVVPARFTHPDWAARVGFPLHTYWPYLTSMFLHGGWLHLFGNMWTHDHPITFDAARDMGLHVSSEMPEDILRLMSLYPQPVKRQASVEYLPVPHRSGRRGGGSNPV